MSYFIFKGVDSRQLGILESLPLDIRSERTTQIVDMPFGTPVIYQAKAFKSQRVTVNLGLTDNSPHKIMEINRLLSGYGELIFSDDLSRHYKAVCNGPLTGTRMIRDMGKIPVTFTVMPFKYNNNTVFEEISLSSLNTASNIGYVSYEGSWPSEPVLKLTGNGNFNMDIDNGTVFLQFFDINEYVLVDVEARKIIDKNGNCINDRTIIGKGSIAQLQLHDNMRIVIDKTVSKVEIDKRTRWL